MPIGGVWADDRLYVTLAPTTISARNAEADPDVVVHLEDANDAVIIEGTVERPPPSDVPIEAARRYGERYGGTWDPADDGMPFFVVRPRLVMTWRSEDIKGTAVRFRFNDDAAG